MSVLVLMYHKTQKTGADGLYDVSLPAFRDHVKALQDGGARFIKFSEVRDQRYYGKDTYVSVTFDDGHASNLDAAEILEGEGITPTLFVVSDWSKSDPAFVSAEAISAARHYCEFGGHGATHTAMTSLSAPALVEELSRSRAYLEQILDRPIEALAFPGGWFDRKVVRAAKASGYSLMGNSVPLINGRPGETINRVVVRNGDTAHSIAHMATANAFYWARRRTRRNATQFAVRLLGSKTYTQVAQGVKRLFK